MSGVKDHSDRIREIGAHLNADELTDADKLVLDSLPAAALTTLAISAKDFVLVMWKFEETY